MACQNIGRSQIKLSKPAKSANQQKAARASLSAKHGGKPKSKLKGVSKSMITVDDGKTALSACRHETDAQA
ncbi:MAG: DUF3008 family protein [Brevundimonas sp.]